MGQFASVTGKVNGAPQHCQPFSSGGPQPEVPVSEIIVPPLQGGGPWQGGGVDSHGGSSAAGQGLHGDDSGAGGG
jgi:hypothetical protein